MEVSCVFRFTRSQQSLHYVPPLSVFTPSFPEMIGRFLRISHHVRPITVFFPLIIIIIFTPFSSSESVDAAHYTMCKEPFDCGSLQNLTYPFWDGSNRPRVCGRPEFQLNCDEPMFPVLVRRDYEPELVVLNISQPSKQMTLARSEFSLCPLQGVMNTGLDETLFRSNPEENTRLNLLYNCTSVPEVHKKNVFSCPLLRDGYFYEGTVDTVLIQALINCDSVVQVPVPRRYLHSSGLQGMEDVETLVRGGFNVSYEVDPDFLVCDECVNSGGVCGTNIRSSSFACFCRNKSFPTSCPPSGEKVNVSRKLAIAVIAAGGTMIFSCGLMALIHCLKNPQRDASISSSPRENTNNNEDIEAFMRKHGPLTLQKYNSSDIKRITNSFKDKLGQGGYGSVYKGKQVDGRVVAVKVLNFSNGYDGGDFINEVSSICKTSHVNVVTLLGFCLEGNQRALIYDFMPNGSLEKFLNKEHNNLDVSEHLGWEKLHDIAIGVARGLEYLHRGCNTRIVHFDIKPHNILLDQDLCPKISDFGLSKLCTRKDSLLSMSMARGTIGYIAPEVFSRQFGGVSHKSDVYSYGMLVLQMVGARTKEEAQTENSSEKYFPAWIYKRLEVDLEFELQQDGVSAQDIELVRKMNIIGLWCIQTNPGERPSISKVIEMLEGPVEALVIPPKPFLSSPIARSLPSFSSSTTSFT